MEDDRPKHLILRGQHLDEMEAIFQRYQWPDRPSFMNFNDEQVEKFAQLLTDYSGSHSQIMREELQAMEQQALYGGR